MELGEELFAVKLYELERQYGKLQSRLRLCRQNRHDKIREEWDRLQKECKEKELALQISVDSSRLPEVSELSRVQLNYCRQAEAILQKVIPPYVHWEEGGLTEKQTERAMLYAEYAIDFSTLAMEYALTVAMAAIDMQLTYDEQKQEANPQ